MAAWNIRGRSWMKSLIRAHKRGVAVQVIMDKVNWGPGHPNPEAAAVAKVLKGKENRPVQSWLKRCSSSCRGKRGIPHSKFYLFSRVNDRSYVTMFGSNNATNVAAEDQWNDLYTWVNNKKIYTTFQNVFNQRSSTGTRAAGRSSGPGSARRSWSTSTPTRARSRPRSATPTCTGSTGSPAAARPAVRASRAAPRSGSCRPRSTASAARSSPASWSTSARPAATSASSTPSWGATCTRS
ncbi:phospholipase D-like domain-containing protein [Pimelobacter simplex]